MKSYTAAEMAKNSRFTEYWLKLDETTRKNVLARIDDLVAHEKQYCDKGN